MSDEQEMTPLEKEFESHVRSIQDMIDRHVEAASVELGKAVALAKLHGVSFRSNISFLSQCYRATPLPKFSELDSEFVDQVTDTWSEYGDEGWAHSAVCY